MEGPMSTALRSNRKVFERTLGNCRRTREQYLNHLPHAEVMALKISLATRLV